MKGPYRAGPWPGLTPAGGGVLLSCAVLLAVLDTVFGNPQRPLPDLPILAAVTLTPLCIATRIVNAPGAASAVTGAYLLPRTLLSLVQPDIPLPPLLLIPALVFDLALWLRTSDLRFRRRRRTRISRVLAPRRAAIAGLLYGFALSAVEPPYRVLLGGDPTAWAADALVPAGIIAMVLSAAISAAVIGRGTAS